MLCILGLAAMTYMLMINAATTDDTSEPESKGERRLTTAFAPATKAELQTATNAWCANEADATGTYGDIGTWVTSAIDDMSTLFNYKTSCNPSGIGSWDVSNVKNFFGMFYQARAFDGDISGWDTSSGTNFE